MSLIDITVGEHNLSDVGNFNIVLGKNGCGKSILLRSVESGLSTQDTYGRCRYITPERGGVLVYQSGVYQNVAGDTNWLEGERRKNQSGNFRQQSVAQYSKLELRVLRKIAAEKRDDKDYTWEQFIEKLNSLLDNVQIQPHGSSFQSVKKDTGNPIDTESLSSGESELISLGIECLTFSEELEPDKENILFLDEPDVHLHPDLQVRLMEFLNALIVSKNFRVVIATHSTALLGALPESEEARVVFMKMDQKDLAFKPVTDSYRKILPVFGAHPLSNVFNLTPILLVEGDDDERIWQQVIRSSEGEVKLYPCSVEGVGDLPAYELEAQEILQTVYDDAKGYSLRDRDDSEGEITDLGSVIRCKLVCRNAENLLVTDEVLEGLGTTWYKLKESMNQWIQNNPEHPHHPILQQFKDGGYNRKDFNLKDVRNDIMGIVGSSKPWEVAVGQAIASINWGDITDFNQANKLAHFLGEKTVKSLLVTH